MKFRETDDTIVGFENKKENRADNAYNKTIVYKIAEVGVKNVKIF